MHGTHPRDPSPRRVGAVSRHIDVLPTLLELLDVPVPRHVQGKSLAASLRGGEDAEPRPVFAQASLRAVKTVALESFAEDGWKIIRHELPAAREELYHLASDPGENHDLSGERPDELARLRAWLAVFRDSLPALAARPARLTDEEREELRALGYLAESPDGRESS